MLCCKRTKCVPPTTLFWGVLSQLPLSCTELQCLYANYKALHQSAGSWNMTRRLLVANKTEQTVPAFLRCQAELHHLKLIGALPRSTRQGMSVCACAVLSPWDWTEVSTLTGSISMVFISKDGSFISERSIQAICTNLHKAPTEKSTPHKPSFSNWVGQCLLHFTSISAPA